MWDIFYTEVLTKMSDSTWMASNEWPGYFAKKYDECMKRGFDNTTKNKVKKGNVEAMTAFLQSAAAMALNSKDESFYKLYYVLIGNAVVQYWTGAELETTSTPLTPADGTLVNLYVTSNVVTNPAPKKFDGSTAPPIKNVEQFLSTFINLAQAHLREVGGVCYTFSQYPSPLPPGPGVLNWIGYKVEMGNIKYGRNSNMFEVNNEDFKLSQAELDWVDKELNRTIDWKAIIEDSIKKNQRSYFKEKAQLDELEEFINLQQLLKNTELNINKDAGINSIKNLPYQKDDLELGARIVAWAKEAAALPVVEAPINSNHGPWVDMVMKRIGKYAYSGDGAGIGYKWCGGATSWWYTHGGALIPSIKAGFNPGSTRSWVDWAQRYGTWTKTPGLGYAILYKDENGLACHIGIVADPRPNKNGRITTIEGNTTSKEFNRNGGGVFCKEASMDRILGYVKPTPDPAWEWT